MKMQKKTLSLIHLVSVLLIALFANLIAERGYLKFDLTENDRYTLSDATRELVRTVPGQVDIKAVISPDIPVQYSTAVRYFTDMLDEYASASNGKVNVEVYRDTDPLVMSEAANLYGIPPLEVNAVESDSFQVKKIYMGAMLMYEGKTEVLPVLVQVQNVEYELTSLIKRMTADEEKFVAILNAGGSFTPEQGAQVLAQALGKNYTVESVELKQGELIDQKYSAAILASPQQTLDEYQQYAVQEYLLSGGSLILALSRVNANPVAGFATPRETGLEAFLEKNGIELTDALLYDASATTVNVPRNVGGFNVQVAAKYPFFPEVVIFSPESTITSGMSAATMVFPTLMKIEGHEGLTITPLATTTEHTGIEESPYNISFDRPYKREDFSNPSQVIALLGKGTFTGSFETAPKGYENRFVTSGSGQLVLFSSGDFTHDQYIGSTENARLLMNAVDAFAEDADLSILRGKTAVPHPITLRDEGIAGVLKFSAIFLPPLAVIILGLFMMRTLKRRREML